MRNTEMPVPLSFLSLSDEVAKQLADNPPDACMVLECIQIGNMMVLVAIKREVLDTEGVATLTGDDVTNVMLSAEQIVEDMLDDETKAELAPVFSMIPRALAVIAEHVVAARVLTEKANARN